MATSPSTSTALRCGASRTHESQTAGERRRCAEPSRPATTRPCTMRSRPMSTTTASAVAIDTSARPAVRPKPSSSTSSSLSPDAPAAGWLAQRQGEQPGHGQHGRRGQTCPRHRLSVGPAATPGQTDQATTSGPAPPTVVSRARPAGLSGKSTPSVAASPSNTSAAISQPPGGAQRIRNWTICSRFERPPRASPRAAPRLDSIQSVSLRPAPVGQSSRDTRHDLAATCGVLSVMRSRDCKW